MNKLGLILILALFMGSPAFAKIVVGKVNIQEVLLTIKQGKKIRNSLKKKFDSKQKILKKEEARIRKMQTDFKKQSLVMNENAKSKRERAIQEKIIALQQKSMTFQKEIQQLEQKLKKPVLVRVKNIIERVSAKAGVDMTFESSTTPLIYAKASKDLTKAVIKAYNTKHPK
ncbi:MAG: OmpH family outer membrane protein [Halobacteriovoraceae bacterium]|jgi:outer membrane protein|nr:OmpH family outer membrane protein [Halobacteriovoraceae bacterium]MBT5096007.1 OmpH family outer membrane protein [Halobacteriovoraceae bacterium]